MKKSLKNLAVASREVEVSYPSNPNFKVRLRYTGRSMLRDIIKRSTKTRINSNLETEQYLDTEALNAIYSREVIIGWSGLTKDVLSTLILIDESAMEDGEELDYSPEDAEFLLSESVPFDKFVNTAMSNLDTFRE